MSSSSSSPIPLTYRILFTYIDPLFCALGFYTHLFTPATVAIGYSPHSISASVPIGVRHQLDNLAAFFAFLFIIEGILLRLQSQDTTVWRTVQAAGCVLDIIMTVGAVRQLSAEGRLGEFYRYSGDDWHHVFGNAVFGVFRCCCALGVGIGNVKPPGKRV